MQIGTEAVGKRHSHNLSKIFIAKMSKITLSGEFEKNENLGKAEVVNDPQGFSNI